MSKNNMQKLRNGILNKQDHVSPDDQLKSSSTSIVNPAIELATGSSVKRATSFKEPILHLSHDQVIIFKYHDRHKSSFTSQEYFQVKRSIDNEGQNFPGVVRKTNQTTPDGRLIYELIVGRLRYEASRDVGFFKAFLKDLDDVQAIKLMLIENEERINITPFERWLSILPIVEDNVLSLNQISEHIGWDKGNLSRSLKAKAVYQECGLDDYLLNTSKVKMHPLIELGSLYEENPSSVKEAISFVVDKYPHLNDSVFIKAILKQLKQAVIPIKKKVSLSASNVLIKKSGESFSINSDGTLNRDDFELLFEELKNLGVIK